MKELFRLLVLMFVISLSGCASTGGYFADRARDAADIFTLSAEAGTIGASVQAGPLMTGLGYGYGKGAGLRSGHAGTYEYIDIHAVLLGYKEFAPDDSRGKDYALTQTVCCTFMRNIFGRSLSSDQHALGNMELSAGCGIGLRAGFNILELLDFIIGWTRIDILNDDSSPEFDTKSTSRFTIDLPTADIQAIRTMPNADLEQRLNRSPANRLALNKVRSQPQTDWLSAVAPFYVLNEIWITAEATPDSSEENKELVIKNLSRAKARECILALDAFSTLADRDSDAAMKYLLVRSGRKPSLLDVCILGRILWGKDKFPSIPDKNSNFDPFQDRSTFAKTEFPDATEDTWKTLLTGSNVVFRYLAASRLPDWAKEEDMETLLSLLMMDDSYSIRWLWLAALRLIPPERQRAMCNSYLENAAIPKMNDSKQEERLVKGMERVLRKLGQAHGQDTKGR